MFENIMKFFKRFGKNDKENSKSTAKERLHLVLAQDRANISADFLEMMKQEIIEVIKKYIDIDEEAIDVRLTNKPGEDGTMGAPSLYANIPIVTIKNEARKLEGSVDKEKKVQEDKKEEQEEIKEAAEDEPKAENEENKEAENEEKQERKEESKKQEELEDKSSKEISKEGKNEEKNS